MGYYIQTSQNHSKAEEIAQKFNGEIIPQPDFKKIPLGKAVIVVIDNGIFEAAAFAYNHDEFIALTMPHDIRPKKFVLIDWDIAVSETGY